MMSIVIVGVLFLAVSLQGAYLPKRPHIVVFLADDMGWNDIGFHNNLVKTPTLDRLAGEGVRLGNYYTKSVCTPSRGELLTGRNAATTGLSIAYRHGFPIALPLSEKILPEKLKKKGYVSHMVGKWHIGHHHLKYTPTKRGFDSFYGIYGGGTDFYTHMNCLSFFDDVCGLDLRNGTLPDRTKNGVYATEIYTQVAKEKIRQHSTKQPMFLYMPFQLVHEPVQVPKKFESLYDGLLPNGTRKTYLGMVSALDDAVSQVVGALDQRGMLDDTVIIFASDNGGTPKQGADNGLYRGIKGSLWEGGIKVPAFVWSRHLERPNRTVNDLITVADWTPTLLGLAGVTGGRPMDGFDVWQVLSKGQKGRRREIIHELISANTFFPPRGEPLFNNTFDTSQRAALRRGKWKIITGTAAFVTEYKDGEPVELNIIGLDPSIRNVSLNKNVWLYNIAKDPYETNDVSEKYPYVVRRLLDRLDAIQKMSPPTIWSKGDPGMNANLLNGVWGPSITVTSDKAFNDCAGGPWFHVCCCLWRDSGLAKKRPLSYPSYNFFF